MKTEIIKIENGSVECPVVNEQRYVAIKPVCEILGIDVDGQRQSIQAHPLYSSVAVKPRNWERWETVSNALFTVETIFSLAWRNSS